MLEAIGLAAVRGEQVVFADLSFNLASGEALLLTGANGSGKSTLLRLLAGLVPAAEGALLWHGGDALSDVPTHAARLRYLGHLDALKPGLTLDENLTLWARLWGGRVAPALEAVGLEGLGHLPARMLSAGQKRRAALARLALAPVPLWLLDEPSVGLDTGSIGLFGAMLATHRAAGGAVVAATHVDLPLPGARIFHLGQPA
ncbi:MAG: heme exporter, ATP-binding protein CcmA [Roseomonas sp.]|jgi:heme exporter protein A|nr:heme exporter, ATP-binding protein CcmA [Roseomonas sp.]